MTRVLVVCTVHKETGNATAAELHWLLGRLRPDVVFVEHSSTDFSTFLDGSCRTLESIAVMHYRACNAVELVPVDLKLPVFELKHKFDAMFNSIAEASLRFCQLELANQQHTDLGGLAYLNSPVGVLMQAEIKREMRTTVDAVGDPWLSDAYAQWTQLIDRREVAMISEVEAFARRTSFNKGALLVGAAHKESLLEKLRQHRNEDTPAQ